MLFMYILRQTYHKCFKKIHLFDERTKIGDKRIKNSDERKREEIRGFRFQVSGLPSATHCMYFSRYCEESST